MKKEISVGIIIPDRCDRYEFTKNCARMFGDAYKSATHAIGKGKPGVIDITARYRTAYEILSYKNQVDVIAFIENDDWYSKNYLKSMIEAWDANGRPELFGTNYTYYYHLKLKAWRKMEHYNRSSAMNTLIKPGLNFEWCADNDPYTDMHLWRVFNASKEYKAVTFTPDKILSIGMKHGIGMCGGDYHTNKFERFVNPDPLMSWLAGHVDSDSFKFYKKMSDELNKKG